MSTVLLFGNLRSSLTAARSLARAGHVVHAGYDEFDPYLVASRCVSGVFPHAPPDKDPESALRHIESYLDAHPEIDVLLPVSEIAARLISRNRAPFEGRVHLLLPAAEVVETCVDKAAMFELCERLGVALARREIVADHAELLASIEVIGRPCIVKPVDSSHYVFGRKAIVLREGDDAHALLPNWPEHHARLCVQEFNEGFRHDVSFVAHQGRLVGAVDCEVRRTDRADGSGYTTELVSRRAHPQVAHGLQALVRALDYTGAGDVEFMVDDRAAKVTFVELNPRLSASFKTSEVCGLPTTLLMLELGLGGAPAARPDPWAHPIGRRFAWTKGELAGFKRDRRGGELTLRQAIRRLAALLRAAAHPHHLTFDLRDPGPTLWLYLHPLWRRFGMSPVARRFAPASPTARDVQPSRPPAVRKLSVPGGTHSAGVGSSPAPG